MRIQLVSSVFCLPYSTSFADVVNENWLTVSSCSVYAPMRIPLSIFTVYVLLSVACGIIISAPDKCGGTRVIKHAHALFGPPVDTADIHDVGLFAPRPQANGAYLRLAMPTHPVASKQVATLSNRLHFLLNYIFGPNSPRTNTLGFANAAPVTHDRSTDSMASSPPSTTLSTSTSSSPSPTSTPLPLPLPLPAAFVSLSLPFPPRRLPDPRRQYQTPPHAQPPPHYVTPSVVGPRDFANSNSNVGSFSDDDIVRVDLNSRRTSSNYNILPLFNACSPLSVQSDQQTIRGKVAVVARGFCEFVTKVSFMQDAGAVAVIVVTPDNKLPAMTVNKSEEARQPNITIPSVMITIDSWSKIAPCVDDANVVFTSQGDDMYNVDSSRDALNWAMMRGMALWILCQCGVNVVRYKRRVSEFRARADAIAALPLETYTRRVDRTGSSSRSQGQPEIGADDPLAEDNAPVSSGFTTIHRMSDSDSERTGLVGMERESSMGSPSGVRQDLQGAGPSLITGSSGGASSSSRIVSAASSTVTQTVAQPSMTIATPMSSSGEQYVPMSTATSTLNGVEDELDSDDDDGVCAICLEEFETGEEVRLLACSHLYHRHCIDPWLQSSSNCCPLCKREVPNLPPPPSQLHYGSMVV